jgi:hypothetical protein
MSISFSLMILIVGFPLLLAILIISDRLLNFERFLLRAVLGYHLAKERPRLSPERRIFAHVGQRLAQGYTWRGLFYLILRFGMGMVSFAMVAALVPASLFLLAAPLMYQFGSMHIDDVKVTTFDQALICCSLGAVLVLVSAHLFNAWTGLWKRVAGVLLR